MTSNHFKLIGTHRLLHWQSLLLLILTFYLKRLILKIVLLRSNNIYNQLRLTIDWDQQLTKNDSQPKSTINWEQKSSEIDNGLRSTINWDWQSTEIDNQLRLTINWDQQSTEINNWLRLTSFITLFKLFNFSSIYCNFKTFLSCFTMNFIWMSW